MHARIHAVSGPMLLLVRLHLDHPKTRTRPTAIEKTHNATQLHVVVFVVPSRPTVSGGPQQSQVWQTKLHVLYRIHVFSFFIVWVTFLSLSLLVSSQDKVGCSLSHRLEVPDIVTCNEMD